MTQTDLIQIAKIYKKNPKLTEYLKIIAKIEFLKSRGYSYVPFVVFKNMDTNDLEAILQLSQLTGTSLELFAKGYQFV